MISRLLAAAILLASPAYGQITPGAPAGPGQLPGTATNDTATAGNVGEIIAARDLNTANAGGSIISIASPAVITWTTHSLTPGTAVSFSTTGALPTGLAINTIYYIIPAGLTANSFEVSAAPFGAAVNTSGTQSGTQTVSTLAPLATGVTANAVAIQLTAGDWDTYCIGNFNSNGTVTQAQIGVSTASATFQTGSSFNSGLISTTVPPTFQAFGFPLQLAAPTIVYCPVNMAFSNAGNVSASLWGRRRR